MKLPIKEVRFNPNKPNDFYKVKIEHKFVWVDVTKFDKEILHVDGDSIVCKEPFEEYFRLTKKTNQNGDFLILEAHKNEALSNQIASEPLAIYQVEPNRNAIPQTPQLLKQVKKENRKVNPVAIDAKYDFIKKLLTNRHLSKEQFDKILKLSDELIKNNDNNEPDKTYSETIDLKKHTPQKTKEFLSFFSSQGLKFLVHDFDVAGMTFEYGIVMETSKKYFDKFTKDKFTKDIFLSKSLYARIHTFAFNSDGHKTWSFNNKNYKYNWKHPEIIEWCRNNPGVSPFSSEKFRHEMIMPFRQSIRVKERELWPLLQSVITHKLSLSYVDFIIDKKVEELDKVDFYNDIEALLKGVSAIVSSIMEQKDRSNQINITYTKKGSRRYLIITHIGSASSKSLNSDILKGDLQQAANNFYRAYHYSIKAHHDGGVQTLHLLYDIEEGEDDFIKNLEIEGFTHIITL
jgi:hypothetical protein